MPKFLLTIIIVLLFLSGCADSDSGKIDAYETYGQDNVCNLRSLSYVIYSEGSFIFIIKGNLHNNKNSVEIDITEFINSKLEENK